MTPILLLMLTGAAEAQDMPTAKVVMPWQDFKSLYDKGMAPEDKPERAPRDWSINHGTYAGNVTEDGTSALFDVRLSVEIHKAEGWVTVPLAPTSVALKSAKIRGKDAPIYLDGGWYMLITDQKGTVDVDLELAASVFEANGQSSLSFPMARSGGTTVTLDVPSEGDLEFAVGQAQFLKDERVRDVRRMEAILPATGNLAVSWQREIGDEDDPEGEGVQQEGRQYAEVHTLVGVGEGVITGHSDINYTIVHQGTDSLTVTIPADVTLLDVTGSGIREWKVDTVDGIQSVDVELNFEALGAYRLMLDYEKGLAEGGGALDIPRVEVQDVERVKGFVGVAALSTLEVVAGDSSGARKIDVRELPASILGRTDQPVLLGYKFREAGWDVPLTVQQHDEVDVLVTIIDTAESISMVTNDGRVMGRSSWYVRNNRRQFLRLDMPEDSEIWSVKVAGKAVKPAIDDEGQVLVPLVRSRASEGSLAAFTVEIVWVEEGTAPDDAGKGTIALDLPQIDVPVTYYRWSVYVPWDAKIAKKSVESSLRQVEWFSTPVTPEGQYLDMAGQAAMQQAYQAQNAAVDSGVSPVDVAMPVEGQALYFEKLLVLDEDLALTLDYKGLKD